MRDIIDLIEVDHLHITRWAASLCELSRQDGDQEPGPVLVRTWQTLASLIELHMRADEEICGPAVLGTGERGRVLARETRAAHEDIREIIRETSLQPPGSLPWWHLARVALAAWAVQLDVEERGPLAECRRRADPALRERLVWQWRAFSEGQIRDQYPQAPPDIPTHRLRQDSDAPATVPQLADPAFGPLACTCRACNRTLFWTIFRQGGHLREQAVAAKTRCTGNSCRRLSKGEVRRSPAAVGCRYQPGRLEVSRSANVAISKTMTVPIRALSTPPQSKMLVSPRPKPTVKMR